ncbi:hypothetical protein SAMD00019534_091420 [Acytostelium subglobosum LB1]|uniref:hypothetical protein n=1 Tax=Acytostelium subglobosum LB1 TaxID=1410327 RepID=UPI000644A44D|nr:hypothetical protein SAMD00019534_091420 [Acytostelium subglobosum LB1]GAM25967.1 hypothetical protein SAMD00019534_091420 [Acytostelium subglobosum LB1]|eukprot:XP_012751010.1 hypothetical protein SAMD00019534_091420 [Acytostelium subglobosum LB1]
MNTHCITEHGCTKTYASCANFRSYRTKLFVADADDKDSIEMMLADGLLKCFHTTCFNFFTSLKSLCQHMSSTRAGDHQCADRNTCPGCQRSDLLMTRQTLPSADHPAIKSYVCLHDGCSKEFDMFRQMLEHCKLQHHCRTYAGCLNQQRYRTVNFKADPDDLESNKMLVVKSLNKCPISTCSSYFKNRDGFRQHFEHCHPGLDLLCMLPQPTGQSAPTLKRKRSMKEVEEEDEDEDEYEEEMDIYVDQDDDDGHNEEEDEGVSLDFTSTSSSPTPSNKVPPSNDNMIKPPELFRMRVPTNMGAEDT